MRAGPMPASRARPGQSGTVLGCRCPAHERQRFEIGDDGARLRREPDGDVARLARRVDPVADVDAGKRRPQRLRHLANRDAERAGQRAIELHVELGFCPLVDRPTSTAPGTFRTSARRPAPDASARAIRAAHLQLNLLLAGIEAGADRRRSTPPAGPASERMSPRPAI